MPDERLLTLRQANQARTTSLRSRAIWIGLGIILIIDAAVMMAGPIFGPEKVSIVVTVPVALYTMLNAATGAEAVLDLFGSMILCVVLIGVATLDD